MANAIKAIEKAFKAEGGFQNYSNDSANYCNGVLIGTNRGISAVAYKGYYGKCPTVSDMKALTKDQAIAIYKRNYWDKINGDNIKNQSVAELIFQYIIGSGSSQISDVKFNVNRTAGRSLMSENDLPITANEAGLINGVDQEKLHANLKQWRYNFYDRLVASNPNKYEPFLSGWKNRLATHVFVPDAEELKKKS